MAKKKKKTAPIIIIRAVVIAAGVLIFTRPKDNFRYEEETVSLRDISVYKSFTGNVTAEDEKTICSEISQKVLNVNVSEGDHINAGDVIAVLDSSDSPNR